MKLYLILITFYLISSTQNIFIVSENTIINFNKNNLGLPFLNVYDKVKALLSKEIHTAPKLIKNAGYYYEKHSVITQDGYILTLHRIPYGRKKSNIKRTPVLCVHGVFGSSTNFILRKSDQSLGFLLADAGHDVWLANTRGTLYSRKHVKYSTKYLPFWDFSFHEKGIYDLPAMIDYILNRTGHKKLAYVGHSEGTTLLYVLLSVMPKYNDKISIGFMMSPVVYLKGSRIPLLNDLSEFSDLLEVSQIILGKGEFLSLIFTMRKKEPWIDHMLILVFVLFFKADLSSLDFKAFNIFLTNARGISVKELNHFVQLYKTGQFRWYNYDLDNFEKYESFTPHFYDLCSVTTPTILYYANNDNVISYKDIKKLNQHLYRSKIIKIDSNMSHSDFIMGNNAKEAIYDEIINILSSNHTLEFAVKEIRVCNKIL